MVVCILDGGNEASVVAVVAFTTVETIDSVVGGVAKDEMHVITEVVSDRVEESVSVTGAVVVTLTMVVVVAVVVVVVVVIVTVIFVLASLGCSLEDNSAGVVAEATVVIASFECVFEHSRANREEMSF